MSVFKKAPMTQGEFAFYLLEVYVNTKYVHLTMSPDVFIQIFFPLKGTLELNMRGLDFVKKIVTRFDQSNLAEDRIDFTSRSLTLETIENYIAGMKWFDSEGALIVEFQRNTDSELMANVYRKFSSGKGDL